MDTGAVKIPFHYKYIHIIVLTVSYAHMCMIAILFFRRAHTVTALILICCVLGYVSFVEDTPKDPSYNHQRYMHTYLNLCIVCVCVCV